MYACQRRRGGTALGTAKRVLTVRVCGWRLGVLKPTRNCFHRRGKRTDIKGKTCTALPIPHPRCHPLSSITGPPGEHSYPTHVLEQEDTPPVRDEEARSISISLEIRPRHLIPA